MKVMTVHAAARDFDADVKYWVDRGWKIHTFSTAATNHWVYFTALLTMDEDDD